AASAGREGEGGGSGHREALLDPVDLLHASPPRGCDPSHGVLVMLDTLSHSPQVTSRMNHQVAPVHYLGRMPPMTDASLRTAPSAAPVRTRAAEPRPGGDARTQLLRAAGRLLAEKGLEGVSLREITRSAGQKNTTALQYHFGDREGLLRALMDLHVPRVSTRRHALIDHLTGRGDVTLREAASILVTPYVTELQ